MPSTRRVKLLAIALAIAVCTIFYLSVRLVVPLLHLYTAPEVRDLLIYMLSS